MLTDPPFMPQKGQPAFHLRDTTPVTDDVIGNNTPEDITRLLGEVEALPPCTTD
jgi:hypothetical protein